MTALINLKLQELIEHSKERTMAKESLPIANAANRIAEHLMKRCPELCAIPGLWFSGSNVWSFLYGQEPDPDADIDVFMLVDKSEKPEEIFKEDRRASLCKSLGIDETDWTISHVKTGYDEDDYRQGVKALYKGGKLDVWECVGSAQDALRSYPHRSHAHCRAAFSFTGGLIVLPNEVAP